MPLEVAASALALCFLSLYRSRARHAAPADGGALADQAELRLPAGSTRS